jgi:hemerythrin-like metal-binding protein
MAASGISYPSAARRPVVYFEWNSQVELGHPLLDEQHKRLFSLSEVVAQTLADSAEHRPAAAALLAVIEFARQHFAAEEGLMRASNYPGTDAHASLHTSLLAELDEYCRKVQRDRNANLTVTGLVAFLWHWLIVHIDSTDRELVGWLQSRELHGSS